MFDFGIILKNMVTDEEKFRAETFRILGISLITPMATILIDPYKYIMEHNIIYCAFYLMFALSFAYVGLIHIEKARAILDKRNKEEWKLHKQK